MGFPKLKAEVDVYIRYESLPVIQQAQMLMALAGMHEALIEARKNRIQRKGKSGKSHAPELCILSMETGHSIRFSVGFEGKHFRIDPSEDVIKISLPEWSATVAVLGTVLVFGVNQGLSIQSRVLENQKMELEIEQLRNDLARDKASQSKFEMNYNQFHYVVNQKNITSVEVNGMSIKNRHRSSYPSSADESSDEDN